ncbi:MAG: phosphatidate cytidylyltransferase [Burkholderiaceae bacterium]|jgi:phosphatidate cytidylyltransferase|nr:phosphatidate cytidylyltransferase [Burkholderiaceae bacterium]
MSNLTQRILTAVVLLALFIPALLVNTLWPFLLLTLLLIAAAGWEWSRLIGWTGWRAWASSALCAVCSILSVLDFTLNPWIRSTGDHPLPWWWTWLAHVQLSLFGMTCLFWVAGVPWLLWGGAAFWIRLPQWLRWGIGMVILILAWVMLGAARVMGVHFLLSALTLVWAADIGAYVFGRALGGKLTGGRKLAPAISPGKSWEGALGGFIAVLLTGAVWIGFERPWLLSLSAMRHSAFSWPSLYAILWLRGPIWFVAGLAALTAMSVVGDLLESLVKRAAGVKDSSGLLPGHGGVLDRIDALLPTLPLAVLVATAASGSGQA